jgi:hypothetical protein
MSGEKALLGTEARISETAYTVSAQADMTPFLGWLPGTMTNKSRS